jgi:nucleotide-binding universal stress UspA family protein
MIALETVLCPVDFSPATPRQVDLAAEVCRAFGARLVLHHNRHSLGAVASVGWMWNADHHGDSQTAVEAKLQECLARVPSDVRAEPLMTEGPVSRAVLAAGEVVTADLVVLTAHGTMADDHASITHRVLEVGFDLARQLPIELHLLHVLPGGHVWRGHHAGTDEEVLARLRALVPGDLTGRVKVDVEHGKAGHGIAAAAERLSAVCIVMGEHTGTAHRWLGRDTPHVVLHEAHCPVWYVPGARAA